MQWLTQRIVRRLWKMSPIVCFACLSAQASDFSIRNAVISAGTQSSRGPFTIRGAIGQPAAGVRLTAGPYAVSGGFWFLPVPVQTPGAPTLMILPAAAGFARISWAPAPPGFVLQEATNLSPANWENSATGAANPVEVPATAPGKYYRLHRP